MLRRSGRVVRASSKVSTALHAVEEVTAEVHFYYMNISTDANLYITCAVGSCARSCCIAARNEREGTNARRDIARGCIARLEGSVLRQSRVPIRK